MKYFEKLIEQIEILSVEGIIEGFESGINPNDLLNGKPLIYELIGGYARGNKFKKCFKVFVDHGLIMEDKILLSVFLDDALLLERLLSETPNAVNNVYTFDCAFTPLKEVSLLHICAEYNHVACAEVLVKYGANINFKAGIDIYGFGGHTPIFHTVNQNLNHCIDVMQFLVHESADLTLTVKGLIWGGGYEWETFIPAVNPISYSMMGLLPQFQRTENHIYEIVRILLKSAYGTDYLPGNVPNKYLKS